MLKLASKQRPDGSSSEGLDGKTLDKGTLMQELLSFLAPYARIYNNKWTQHLTSSHHTACKVH